MLPLHRGPLEALVSRATVGSAARRTKDKRAGQIKKRQSLDGHTSLRCEPNDGGFNLRRYEETPSR